jgi:hypothetical protein
MRAEVGVVRLSYLCLGGGQVPGLKSNEYAVKLVETKTIRLTQLRISKKFFLSNSYCHSFFLFFLLCGVLISRCDSLLRLHYYTKNLSALFIAVA